MILSAADSMYELPVVFARHHGCEQLAQWLDGQGVQNLSDLGFIVRMSAIGFAPKEILMPFGL